MRTAWAIGMGLAAIAMTAWPSAQTAAQWQDVIRNLRHPSAETRLAAVTRLGEAAYAPAAEAIAPLVTDSDDRVQVAAIEAELSFYQSDRVGSTRILGLGGSKSRAQEAFDAGPLFRAAAPASPVVLERLIAAIRDENARVRFDAVHAVGFIAEAPLAGEPAKRLSAELDHYDPIIRAATARVLGRLRAREVAGAVAAALVDSNGLVRQYATEALGLMRDRTAAIELRQQLPRSRGAALETTFLALARIGERDDLEFFRARTSDRNEVLRRAAFEGLGRAGDKDGFEALDRALTTERSDRVRMAAAFGLTLLGRSEAHVIAAHVALDSLTEQTREYLIEIGRPAIPALQATLKVATDARHKANLAQIVGYVGTGDDVAVLEPYAADRDERVRRAVLHAVQRLRGR